MLSLALGCGFGLGQPEQRLESDSKIESSKEYSTAHGKDGPQFWNGSRCDEDAEHETKEEGKSVPDSHTKFQVERGVAASRGFICYGLPACGF